MSLEEIHTVYHVTSLDDFTPCGLEKDSVTQERQSLVTARHPPGRSLAKRQLDKPRALSSTWISAKVSSSDFCEEMINEVVGGHRMNTRRQEAQCIEVFRQMPC